MWLLGFGIYTGDKPLHSESKMATKIKIWILLFHLCNVFLLCSSGICGFPGSPANGSVVIKQNTKATYTCDTGFVLFGDLHRECLDNGSWSGEVPTCDFNLAKGHRATQSETFFNYTANQAVDGLFETCSFTPKVSERRWWQVQLSEIYTIAAVAITIGAGVAHKFTVFVVSIEGNGKLSYDLCGSFDGVFDSETNVMVCNRGKGQTGQLIFIRDDRDIFDYFGLCEVEVFKRRDSHLCGKPETGVHMKSNALSNREIQYECLSGRKLVGVANHRCIDGRWRGPIPICEEIACEIPTEIPNGVIQVFAVEERFIVGTVANYSCDPGYELYGNAIRTCDESGNWSGKPPECLSIDCGPIPSILHGVIEVNSSTWGSSGIVICDDGFHVSSNAQVYCSHAKQWILVNASCQDAVALVEVDSVAGGNITACGSRGTRRSYVSVVIGSIVAIVITLAGIVMIAYLRKRWIFSLIKGDSNDVTKTGFHPNTIGNSHSNLVDDPIYDDISYANNSYNTDQQSGPSEQPPLDTSSNIQIYDQPAGDEPIYYTPVEYPTTRDLPVVVASEIFAENGENPVYEVLDAKGLDDAIYAQVDFEKKKKDREESFRRRQKSVTSVDLNPDSGVYENVSIGDSIGSSSLRDSQSVLRPLPPIPSESSLITSLEMLDNSEIYHDGTSDQMVPEDDAKWEQSDSIYAALDLANKQ